MGRGGAGIRSWGFFFHSCHWLAAALGWVFSSFFLSSCWIIKWILQMPGEVMFVEFSQQTLRVFIEIYKPHFAWCFIGGVYGCALLFSGPAAINVPHLQKGSNRSHATARGRISWDPQWCQSYSRFHQQGHHLQRESCENSSSHLYFHPFPFLQGCIFCLFPFSRAVFSSIPIFPGLYFFSLPIFPGLFFQGCIFFIPSHFSRAVFSVSHFSRAVFFVSPRFSRPAALPLPGLQAGGRQKVFFPASHLQQNDNPGAPWSAASLAAIPCLCIQNDPVSCELTNLNENPTGPKPEGHRRPAVMCGNIWLKLQLLQECRGQQQK